MIRLLITIHHSSEVPLPPYLSATSLPSFLSMFPRNFASSHSITLALALPSILILILRRLRRLPRVSFVLFCCPFCQRLRRCFVSDAVSSYGLR